VAAAVAVLHPLGGTTAAPFGAFGVPLFGAHVVIELGEAAVTGLAIWGDGPRRGSHRGRTRADRLHDPAHPGPGRNGSPERFLRPNREDRRPAARGRPGQVPWWPLGVRLVMVWVGCSAFSAELLTSPPWRCTPRPTAPA